MTAAPAVLDGLRAAMDGIAAAAAPRRLAPVPDPPSQRDVIDAVNVSEHVHGRDLERVRAAIREVARAAGGLVDPNVVRARLTDAHGELVVYPRTIGAQYSGLRSLGIIEQVGWTTSTDRRGRNAGRPARTYRVTNQEWLRGGSPAAAPEPVFHSSAETGELFAVGDVDG